MHWIVSLMLAALIGLHPGAPLVSIEGGERPEIPWSPERKLTWKDFKAQPPFGASMDAQTQSGIEYSWGCNGNQFRIEVEARFDPNTSWAKRGVSEALLRHEQLHFDITELHARKMRKRFQEVRNVCARGKSFIRSEARKILDSWHEMQNSYDKETNHSKISESQKAWERKVAQHLEDLERYRY